MGWPSMNFDLEFEDGSYANANSSMWLHHVLLFNANQTDVACPIADHRQRTVASGNERGVLDFTLEGSV